MKKIIALILIGVMLFAPMVEGQTRKQKLKRGTVNLLTGWVEIPKNIYDTSVEENKITGFSKGLIEGIGMAVVRTGTGVYEIITFPFEVPENYEVILEPEYVVGNEKS